MTRKQWAYIMIGLQILIIAGFLFVIDPDNLRWGPILGIAAMLFGIFGILIAIRASKKDSN